jgi:hypothetical protein
MGAHALAVLRTRAHVANETDALARHGANQVCASPRLPSALRGALTRLATVESDTIRPLQTASMRLI